MPRRTTDAEHMPPPHRRPKRDGAGAALGEGQGKELLPERAVLRDPEPRAGWVAEAGGVVGTRDEHVPAGREDAGRDPRRSCGGVPEEDGRAGARLARGADIGPPP